MPASVTTSTVRPARTSASSRGHPRDLDRVVVADHPPAHASRPAPPRATAAAGCPRRRRRPPSPAPRAAAARRRGSRRAGSPRGRDRPPGHGPCTRPPVRSARGPAHAPVSRRPTSSREQPTIASVGESTVVGRAVGARPRTPHAASSTSTTTVAEVPALGRGGRRSPPARRASAPAGPADADGPPARLGRHPRRSR